MEPRQGKTKHLKQKLSFWLNPPPEEKKPMYIWNKRKCIMYKLFASTNFVSPNRKCILEWTHQAAISGTFSLYLSSKSLFMSCRVLRICLGCSNRKQEFSLQPTQRTSCTSKASSSWPSIESFNPKRCLAYISKQNHILY